jgi:pimeloyl-ACP methyl ester carboxylesterase
MSSQRPSFANDAWPGNTLITGGKGYAPTPMGQIHYRVVGPDNPKGVFVLLHQSQMSLVQYGETQEELASLGYRSVALDTPGHGMSDLPPTQPTLDQLADNILPVLDHLKVTAFFVAGHHSGAALSASLAARYPDRVSALILHGVPLFSDEERARIKQMVLYNRTPRADGAHLGGWFRPFPGDVPSDAATLNSRTWMLLSLYMMGPDVGKPAVFDFDMETALRQVKAPTLLLTDEADPIHGQDERVAKLRPDFTYRVFSRNGPMSQMNEPKRWAGTLADFVGALGRTG